MLDHQGLAVRGNSEGGRVSKPVRIGGGGGEVIEGPSCTISRSDVFLQGLAEGGDVILHRDA